MDYSIYSVFFKERERIGLGTTDILDGECDGENCRFTCFGRIQKKEGYGEGILTGAMYDAFGPSQLCDIVIAGEVLQFTKQYHNGPVFHTLRKKPDGIWEGAYVGPKFGKGIIRLMLADIPSGFPEFPDVLAGSVARS